MISMFTNSRNFIPMPSTINVALGGAFDARGVLSDRGPT
jgi:hypothetical protein